VEIEGCKLKEAAYSILGDNRSNYFGISLMPGGQPCHAAMKAWRVESDSGSWDILSAPSAGKR
jgi:hypothetical protein